MSISSTFTTPNLNLKKLLEEPQRLENEALKINAEIEALVSENYKIFIQNLTCSIEIREEESKLFFLLKNISAKTNDFNQCLTNLSENSINFYNNYRKNKKTLNYHIQLIELLEVPQLIELCINNQHYNEAIELANFINSLEHRHFLTYEVKMKSFLDNTSNSNPTTTNDEIYNTSKDIIQKIVFNVHKILKHFQFNLLLKLIELNTIDKNIFILSTLRKIDSLFIDRQILRDRINVLRLLNSSSSSSSSINSTLSPTSGTLFNENIELNYEKLRSKYLEAAEIKLQMDFLEASSLYIIKQNEKNEILSSTASSSTSSATTNSSSSSSSGSTSSSSSISYTRSIEILELNRKLIYSIVTQFNLLFNSSLSPSFSSSSPSSTSSSSLSSSLTTLNYSSKTILTTWIKKEYNSLITSLLNYLPLINDGLSLRSLYEQCFYFSNRFNILGCNPEELLLNNFNILQKKYCIKILKKIFIQYYFIINNEKLFILYDDLILSSSLSNNNSITLSSLSSSILSNSSSSSSSSLTSSATSLPSSSSSLYLSDLNIIIKKYINNDDLLLENFNEIEFLQNNRIDFSLFPSQLIPLYLPQDISSSLENDSTTTTSTSSTTSSLLPPYQLLNYPPLSFLMNSILNLINYIRECPLINSYEIFLNLLEKFFIKISNNLLINLSLIKSKGVKYLKNNPDNTKNNTKNINNKDSNDNNISLDILYILNYCYNLIPHIFISIDIIFGKLSSNIFQSLKSSSDLSLNNNKNNFILSSWKLTEKLLPDDMINRLLKIYQPFIEANLIKLNELEPIVNLPPSTTTTTVPISTTDVEPINTNLESSSINSDPILDSSSNTDTI